MKAPCTIAQQPDGRWLACHSSSFLGTVEISAPSRDEALIKMRNELQYRSEYCPCTGASEDTVELQITEASSGDQFQA